MSVRNEKRLLVIGLDGATFDLIRPLAARGQLPTIARLMAQGWSAPLRSTVPAITPPAWSSFATGAPPQDHGVFGFSYPDARDHSLRLTLASDVQRPTLWRRLSQRGPSVLLLDVPFTFPPEPVNGCLIAGFPLPATGSFTHPSDLAERLDGAGVARPRHPVESPDPATPQFSSWLDEFLAGRLQVFRYLTAQQSWRFAMAGTMALDWAQHALWKYCDRRFVWAGEPEAAERRERLFAIYRRMDRFVADLREIAGEQTDVLLVSDHGFGTTFHYDWVVEALSQAGLLFWRKACQNFAASIGAVALKAARSSPRLQRLGKKLLGDVRGPRSWARRPRAYSQIDWERTRMFPASDYHLNLYVNSQSRFARGIVADGADYEKVMADAISALETFCPPGYSQRLVQRIVRYEGGAKGLPTRVPDLSLELTTFPAPDEPDIIKPQAGISGFHTPEGICIASTVELFGGDRPAKMEITDLASVILAYFGLQPDDETQAERAGPLQDLSTEQSAAVLDSLRHLGYLD